MYKLGKEGDEGWEGEAGNVRTGGCIKGRRVKDAWKWLGGEMGEDGTR